MIISKDVFNAMIKSQLSYCPLISILPSRKSNNLIKQRSLNTVKASLNWSNSSFELWNYHNPPEKPTNSN